MTAVLVPFVLIAVVLVLGALALRRWGGRRQRLADELADPATPTLDYLVPAGQDPVVVLATLAAEGYEATVDPDVTQLVHVACPAGADRERAHVRAALETADTTSLEGGPIEPAPVRFADET